MKIVHFKQENVCCMLKDNQIKIDRSDIWGEPQESKESLLAYCQKFCEAGDDETAHVVYLYGQGGVGKSFVCREVSEKLQEAYQEKLYVISVDLQRQKGFEDDLKCLADEIEAQTGKKDIFQRFHIAYYNYKIKAGEEYTQEERSTKWDNLHDNSSFNLAVQTANFFTSFGVVGDAIDLANEGYRWLRKMRDSVKYKTLTRQIEAMDEKELREQLCRYFAMDFGTLLEDKKNEKRKKFAFLLDTVESMRYQMLRSGKDEDYLEWLAGNNGLFRLLPGCFWLLFGREEISWKEYDKEWEISFLNKKFTTPDKAAVREYLLRQFAQKPLRESDKAELQTLADTIAEQTDGYCLAIENCVDVYFRIWNNKLRENRITVESKVDPYSYRPSLKEMEEMFLDGQGKKKISARFMQYYTPQEREVLYTLVCLGTWTEDILEKLIWRGAANNILIYEEMCGTSFIQSGSNGEKSIQGLMLDAIMDECAQRLKKQLLLCILNQMGRQEINASYWLLYRSAVHIAKFYPCEEKEWKLLGDEFIRAVEYLETHGRFFDLLAICQALLEVSDVRNVDEDLHNAALVGLIFAHIFCKEDMQEKYDILLEKQCISDYCLKVWERLLYTAREVGAFAQAYKITEFLEKRVSVQDKTSLCHYKLLRAKVELMQELSQRYEYTQPEEEKLSFTYEQLENEIQALCELTLEAASDPTDAQKLNARFWAEYYYNIRRDLWGDIAPQRIQKCIEEYSSGCTKHEIEQDAVLCFLRLMKEKSTKSYDFVKESEIAISGMRLLYGLYGEDAIERAEMKFMFQCVIPCYFMPEADSEFLRRIFAAYCRKFSKGEDLEVFQILVSLCTGFGLFSAVGEPEEGEVRLEVSDIIQRELLYLSNVRKDSDRAQIRLLLTYYLLELSMPFSQGSLWDEKRYRTEDMSTIVTRKLLNNRVLLYLLKQSVEAAGTEKGEAEKLCSLLGFICKENIGEQGKRNVLSLLTLCGIDVDRVVWKAEYAGESLKEEKDILSAFREWQWRMDTETDIWMANIVLYAAWNLVKADDPEKASTEDKIWEFLKKKFDLVAGSENVEFWKGLIEEAAALDTEYEQHVRKLFQKMLADVSEKKLTEKTRKMLAVYDARFEKGLESNAKPGENAFEKELRARLAEGDYDTARSMIQEKDAECRRGGRLVGFSTELCVAYFYSPQVKNKGTDGFVEAIQKLKSNVFLGGEYLVLRAYAYLDDKENFVRHYWENRKAIWENLKGSFWCDVEGEFRNMAEYIHSINEEELRKDYCIQYMNMCAEGGVYFKDHYMEVFLADSEWLAEIVPFQEIWKKESCVKEIRLSNYSNIYQCLCRHLPQEELLDVFAVSVWDGGKLSLPQKTEMAFFESEYYQWLRSTFGKAVEDKLKTRFPELYAAREEYEENQKDHYLRQMHKMICEIKDMK